MWQKKVIVFVVGLALVLAAASTNVVQITVDGGQTIACSPQGSGGGGC